MIQYLLKYIAGFDLLIVFLRIIGLYLYRTLLLLCFGKAFHIRVMQDLVNALGSVSFCVF